VTGGLSLALGPSLGVRLHAKRRVLDYSLDPNQKGDEFLFNLLIAPVAITVNFFASLAGGRPGAPHRQAPQPGPGHHPSRHRRVHGLVGRHASCGSASTEFFQVGKLLAVVFLFLGFLVSVEAFAEFRVPFNAHRP